MEAAGRGAQGKIMMGAGCKEGRRRTGEGRDEGEKTGLGFLAGKE